MTRKVQLLNVDIDSLTLDNLLANLNSGFVVTPNVDHLVKLQKDRDFYQVYQSADWVVCDSKIVALAAKFLGQPIKEVIPGSSFFPAYCSYHKSNPSIKVFLLGAAKGVAAQAMANINARIGRDIIVGAHSPSYGFEMDDDECLDIIDIINKSGANVLLVGVGAPKQEKWIAKYKDQLTNVNLFLPLGATIDFEAGALKRAPKIFQYTGMEWFYRLCKEPKRLWKRYLVDDMMFFYYLFLQKIGRYKNPF